MTHTHNPMNKVIGRITAYFSFDLLLAAVFAAIYTGESLPQVFASWYGILISPCPLVTDYFKLGSLPAAFLNAGLCGSCCALMTQLPDAKYKPGVWAGYFLVIAHCFYGLNLLNMWPPMFGFWVYCRLHKLKFRDNLDWAMFITSFAPFFSEMLFRYPLPMEFDFWVGPLHIKPMALLLCLLMSTFFGCVLPALLPGTSKLHRGFNLYNAGLATGLLGLFIYAFMFNTMGVSKPDPLELTNAAYEAHGESYMLFCSIFFVIMFSACVLYGWYINGKTFKGYKELLADSGYKANFMRDYGYGVTCINLGFYGLMMLAYFDTVILLTDGAGFTGATCGILLAAMTFSAAGQHPRNVWPILLGYGCLSLLVHAECAVSGRPIPWTLSTQGYMNGLAFATGLCPFSGKFGWKVGVLAGFISAVMCTTTSVMHGGFVLYNGGLTAGISALILLPILDTYLTHDEKWAHGHHWE